MPVSKEELVKDLETPEYQTIVKDALAKKEFVIRDKAEDSSFLDRYKADVIEKEIPSKIKEVYDKLDIDIKTTFGVDREANEKTYEYLKRAGKVKLTALDTSAAKIAELEAAIAKGDTSAAMAKKLETEQENWKKKSREYETTIQKLQTENQVTSKAADVKLVYGELKKTFVKQLPALFARAEAAALDEAINNSIVKDGKLYMANADGTIKKDSKYNEITVEDFLKAEFKEVIEEKKTQGGGGSDPKAGGDGTDPKDLNAKNFKKPDNIKTKATLTDHMLSLGLKQGTAQFNDIWRAYGLPMAE